MCKYADVQMCRCADATIIIAMGLKPIAMKRTLLNEKKADDPLDHRLYIPVSTNYSTDFFVGNFPSLVYN